MVVHTLLIDVFAVSVAKGLCFLLEFLMLCIILFFHKLLVRTHGQSQPMGVLLKHQNNQPFCQNTAVDPPQWSYNTDPLSLPIPQTAGSLTPWVWITLKRSARSECCMLISLPYNCLNTVNFRHNFAILLFLSLCCTVVYLFVSVLWSFMLPCCTERAKDAKETGINVLSLISGPKTTM